MSGYDNSDMGPTFVEEEPDYAQAGMRSGMGSETSIFVSMISNNLCFNCLQIYFICQNLHHFQFHLTSLALKEEMFHVKLKIKTPYCN